MRATSRRSTGPACVRHSERVRSAGSTLTRNTAWCGTRQRRWSEARGLDNTLPYAYDTDEDGYSDGYEVANAENGFDPLEYTHAASKLRYVWEFAKGGTCGEVCGSDPDIAWLMGNLAGGLVGISDITSFLGSIGHGDLFGATTSLAGLIPIVGDGESSFVKVEQFAQENPELEDEVIQAIRGLARMRASTKLRMITELTEDGAASLTRLRGFGLTDDAIVALARDRKSFTDLDHAVVNADEVIVSDATALANIDSSDAALAAGWFRDGAQAETHLTNRFGEIPQPLKQLRVEVPGISKYLGRKYDGYDATTKTGYEVKVGTQNRFLVRKEIEKDQYVLDNPDDFPDVKNLVWEFYPRLLNNGKGRLGPDQALMDALKADPRIKVRIYLPNIVP